MSETIKYFPFSPGIPWKIKRNKYIIPKINYDLYYKVIKNKNIVLLCFGGFFETYFSLSIFEELKQLNINNKLFFKGNEKFNFLPLYQGLSKIFPYNLDKNITLKYPVPLFFDKNDNVYINCLNDYIDLKGFLGTGKFKNSKPIFKQIFQNSLLNWDNNFPIFRNNQYSKIEQWSKLNKFDIKKPYIMLFPFKTECSEFQDEYLDWNLYDVKKFISMVSSYVNVVVCHNNKQDLFNTRAYVIDNSSLDLIIPLLQSASFVISKEVDYILCSLFKY